MGNLDEIARWPGWETVRILGRGSFGAVYEIQRDVLGKTEYAALKVLSIPQSDNDVEELYASGYNDESISSYFQNYLTDIVREYQLMLDMKGHTNVVYCDDFRYVQQDNGFGWTIYIKMELLTPLLKSLGNEIGEDSVIRLGRDIANALVLCRSRNILHRDIKPQNIFLSRDGDYKLGDFGIAKTADRTMGGTKIGTYNYMAPEVYNNEPYGHQADIYSLGLVMYWMLNERRMPFVALPPASPTAAMQEEARLRRFRGEALPAPAHGSPELQRIVLKACAPNPKQRYQSAEELRDDLARLLDGTADETDDDATVMTDYLLDRTENEGQEQKEEEKKEEENHAGDAAEKKKKKTRSLLVTLLLVLGLAAGAWLLRDRLPLPSSASPSPVPTAADPADTSAPNPTPIPAPTPEPTPEIRQYKKNDIIRFGHFNGMNSKSGESEPLEWRVLDTDGDRLFVLCETGLTDKVDYGDREEFYRKWSDSYARLWLNGEFFETAFSPEEQAMIQETSLTDPAVDDLSFYVPAMGREISLADPTTDRIFLLSKSEYLQYFGEQCRYVKTGYSSDYGSRSLYILNSWALRTMGTYPGMGGLCCVVSSVGRHTISSANNTENYYSKLEEHGNSLDNACTLCPAMWIRIPEGWDGFLRHGTAIQPYSGETKSSSPLELGSYPLSDWTSWQKKHFYLTNWGGVYIDGSGNLWQLDSQTLTAQRLNIGYADGFAWGAGSQRIPVLRKDGSIMVLHYDEADKKVVQDTTVSLPQRVVSLCADSDDLYAVTQDGRVYYYDAWRQKDAPVLIEGLPPMAYVQVDSMYLVFNNELDTHYFLGKGLDGKYYVWGLNIFDRRYVDSYEAVLNEPVPIDAFQDYYFVYLLDGCFVGLDKNRRLESYDSTGHLLETLDNVAYLSLDSNSNSGYPSCVITTKGEVFSRGYPLSSFKFDYGGQEAMRFEWADNGWLRARYLPGSIKEVHAAGYCGFRLEDGRVFVRLDKKTGNGSESVVGFLKDARGQEIHFA